MSKYNYIKWFDEIGKEDVGIVGGKGANLGELTSFGLPVPPGFCVTAEAYTKFIKYAELDEVVKFLMEAVDVENVDDLTFAKGFPYNASHRHFSHALAIHPLGIIDWSDGEKAQRIIRATLKKMNDYGPDYWTGYTYSWFANMQARAFNGEEAAKALRTFAKCLCGPYVSEG